MSAFLEVTTYAGRCPNTCKYCPQDLFVSRYTDSEKMLSLANFMVAIDKLPPNSTIAFSGFNEPAINRELSEMVLYADLMGHRVMLLTTLIGLSVEKYKQIKHINFDHFSVHLPDDEKKTVVPINLVYLELLEYVSKNKPNGNFLFNIHGNKVDGRIGHLVSSADIITINNRAGNLDSVDDKVVKVKHEGKVRCGHRFIYNSPSGGGLMLPNGDIYLCCMDFGLRHRLGNLLDQSWEGIMASEAFKGICEGLNDSSSVILCKNCYLASKG